MKENDSGLKHRDLTQKIIGVFYEVYNELGHGFLESVYESAFDQLLHRKVCRYLDRLRYRSGSVDIRLVTLRLICLWKRASY